MNPSTLKIINKCCKNFKIFNFFIVSVLRKFCITRRTEAVVVTCGSILNYFGTTVKLKIRSPGNVNGFVGVRKQLRFLIIPLQCKHLNPSTLKAINAVRILKSMKISFGVDLGFASDYFKGYGTILRCLVCAFCSEYSTPHVMG